MKSYFRITAQIWIWITPQIWIWRAVIGGLLAMASPAIAQDYLLANSREHMFSAYVEGGAAWCGKTMRIRLELQPRSPEAVDPAALAATMHWMKTPILNGCKVASGAEIRVLVGGRPSGVYQARIENDWVFAAIPAARPPVALPAPPAAPVPVPPPGIPAPRPPIAAVAALAPASAPAPAIGTTITALESASYLPGLRNLVVTTVVMDKARNIYIAGSCSNNTPVIAKLDPTGSYYVWVRSFSKTAHQCATQQPPGLEADGLIKAIAIDEDAGKIYVTGDINNYQAFPVAKAFRPAADADPNARLGSEAFVARLSTDGAIDYSTLIGGGKDDFGMGVAIDHRGGAWVVGNTKSPDFLRIGALYEYRATTNNPHLVNEGPMTNGFVVHLDSNGRPAFSTYFATTCNDGAVRSRGAVSDRSGNLYLLGAVCYSAAWGKPDVPVTAGVVNPTGSSSGNSAFLSKFSVDTNQLIYSTYIGGTADSTHPTSFLVDDSGAAMITGWVNTVSQNGGFPNVGDSERPKNGGSGMVFLAKLSPDATRYELAKIMAPGVDEGNSQALALAVGADRSIYLAGSTCCTANLPGKPWFDSVHHGLNSQGFLIKLDSAGHALWHSSLTSGGPRRNSPMDPYTEFAYGMSASGDAVTVIGRTAASDFPTMPGAIGRNLNDTDPPLRNWLLRLAEKPASERCRISTNPSNLEVSNQGDQNLRFFVVTNRGDCAWTIASDVPWMKASPSDPASGIGTVKVVVDTDIDQKRVGTITARLPDGTSASVTVTQKAAVCRYNLNPEIVPVVGRGRANVFLQVSTGPECPWQEHADAPWVAASKTEGNGEGSFVLGISENTTGAPRKAIVDIGGRQVSITQLANDLPPSMIELAIGAVDLLCDKNKPPKIDVDELLQRGLHADGGGNHAEGMCWFGLAADRGSARADTYIGTLYRDGLGVTADADQALAHFEKAAKQGDTAAMTNLAIIYESGKGAPPDHDEAKYWEQAAAAAKAARSDICSRKAMTDAMIRLIDDGARDPAIIGLKLFAAFVADISYDEQIKGVVGTAVTDVTSDTGEFTCLVGFSRQVDVAVIGGAQAEAKTAANRALRSLHAGNYSAAESSANEAISAANTAVVADIAASITSSLFKDAPEIQSFVVKKLPDGSYRVSYSPWFATAKTFSAIVPGAS
jgi:hypothetical protein